MLFLYIWIIKYITDICFVFKRLNIFKHVFFLNYLSFVFLKNASASIFDFSWLYTLYITHIVWILKVFLIEFFWSKRSLIFFLLKYFILLLLNLTVIIIVFVQVFKCNIYIIKFSFLNLLFLRIYFIFFIFNTDLPSC